MVNVNTSLILGLVIPYPQPEEQERIEIMLAQHDNRKQADEASLGKLALMKKGLMQDLLTGRVRVKVPVEETRC
jgi:type I restriction enzyme S subunit